MIGHSGLLPEKISKLTPSANCMSERIKSGGGFLCNHSFVSLTLAIGPTIVDEGSISFTSLIRLSATRTSSSIIKIVITGADSLQKYLFHLLSGLDDHSGKRIIVVAGQVPVCWNVRSAVLFACYCEYEDSHPRHKF